MKWLRLSTTFAIRQTPSALAQSSQPGCTGVASSACSMARLAAQQLAEADPAGWAFGGSCLARPLGLESW
jgi:hypothetical protein